MSNRISAAIPLAALCGSAVMAQSGPEPDYLDDRSTPARVVESLYNAIGRREYLRAWSYFRDGAAKPFEVFRDGYADTISVDLRVGDVTGEGAAGSIHSAVPVALRAASRDGTETVFEGCYRLVQVQPAVQETPPFRPIQIEAGILRKTGTPFETAMGACEE